MVVSESVSAFPASDRAAGTGSAMGAYRVVVAELHAFRHSIAQRATALDIQRDVEATIGRLAAVQHRVCDRPHLAKSLCQMGTILRRLGQTDAAQMPLQWAIAHDVVDGYVFGELLQCRLAAHDLQGAIRVLEHARRQRLAGDVMYSALLMALARAGQVEEAETVFAHGEAEGALGAVSYAALIDVYGRASNPHRAQQVFDLALRRELATARSYTSLIHAYKRVKDWAGCRGAFERARHHGAVDSGTYAAFILCEGQRGAILQARLVFDEAVAAGGDERVYAAMIQGYIRKGWLRWARWVLKRAADAGHCDAKMCQALNDAYRTTGWRTRPARRRNNRTPPGVGDAHVAAARHSNH